MTTNTTRRAVIGALAWAAPAAALATAPTAKNGTASPALAEAIRQAREAAAAQVAFDPIERAARDRYEAGVAALPHFTASYPNQGGGVTTMTTAEPRMVALAKTLSRGIATDHTGNPRSFAQRVAMKQDDYMKASRHVAAGALWRDRQMARIARLTGLAAANVESNRLSDLHAEAEILAYECPVSTLCDLKAKLAFMVETGGFEVTSAQSIIVSDVDRILAQEA